MPCVFYGDELGTEGFEDPFCRAYFDWARVNENPLREFFRTLMHLKNEKDALRLGEVWIEPWGEHALRIRREKDGKRIFAFVNMGEETSVPLPEKLLLSEGGRTEGETLRLNSYGFVLWEE